MYVDIFVDLHLPHQRM